MTAEDAEWMLAQMGEEEEGEDDNDDDEEMASNVDEEKEGQNIDASVSKDERIARFKEMLCDIGVNPFGTWEMECKNYESDPRFALIDTPAEQRDLFEVVCKQVAAAAKTSKPSSSSSSSNTKASSKDKAAEAANRVDMTGLLHPFDQLLCETVTKKKTSFAKFCQKNLKDPRFTSIKTSREREKRFNRHLEENIQ
ncbi:hypothetical protein GGF42_007807 [Coemansia sp. RSA 2424]|nr:hypothetical protein GGF42_007807 [Coemansia sp. RSA 2424]